MVRAPWRHGETREQGSRTGRCGWITSFLRSFKFLVEDTDLRPAGNGSPGTLFSSEGAGTGPPLISRSLDFAASFSSLCLTRVRTWLMPFLLKYSERYAPQDP
jgi:hypothetical protein